MTFLQSTNTAYAGLFGPTAILSTTGGLLSSIAVSIYNATTSLTQSTTLATLFTNQNKTTVASNPTSTDTYGNLSFWADPGYYFIVFSGSVAETIMVQVDAYFADSTLNAPIADTGASILPNFGDMRFANAGSNNMTYTLPAAGALIGGSSNYTSGGRIRITRTDSTTNTLTINAPTGAVIYGPGLGLAGQASISLNAFSSFVDVVSDGVNYHVVGGAADTGWVSISSPFAISGTATGWVTSTSYLTPPTQYRLQGNICRLQGWVWPGVYAFGNSTSANNTIVFQLPSICYPKNSQNFIAVTDISPAYTFPTISTSGILEMTGYPSTQYPNVNLGTLEWTVD